jgi:dolichol kinase
MIGQLSKEEINRKLLHLLAIILPFGIFYLPIVWKIHPIGVCCLIFFLLFISLLIEYFRLRETPFGSWFSDSFGSMMRTEEKKQLTGATYVLGGSLICSLVSLYNEVAAVSCFLCLTLFILGDAVAAIVGKAFGRIKVGNKTVEGGVGCFLFCVLTTGFIFPELPAFTDFWGGEISIVQIFLISASIAILEFFPIKFRGFALNDNLYVPGLSSAIAIMIR